MDAFKQILYLIIVFFILAMIGYAQTQGGF